MPWRDFWKLSKSAFVSLRMLGIALVGQGVSQQVHAHSILVPPC